MGPQLYADKTTNSVYLTRKFNRMSMIGIIITVETLVLSNKDLRTTTKNIRYSTERIFRSFDTQCLP